eukprot:TRINITY_DN8679_c0_g1_i1.p1 TRINITY_DN8679_c0_g1~~TRINITY_DN8679_c0_g1_i1.p1  ORF type:complete len:356 (+),score=82.88 TRINITY_DN8679_c0_g1_i1:41-1069(+)
MDDKIRLLFSVRDSGIGISKEKQKEVFKAFSQADSSTTRLYGGTGLGLSIVDRLVSMMGGRIWLESEPGKGSTFFFIACFDRANTVLNNEAICQLLMAEHEKDTLPITGETSKSTSHSGEWRITVINDSLQEDSSSYYSHGNDTVQRLKPNPELACKLSLDINSEGGILDNKSLERCEIYGTNGVSTNNSNSHMDVKHHSVVNSKMEDNENAIPLKGMRVLLAEDNVVNQKVACQQLRKFGTEVDVVSDGQQCLNILKLDWDKYDLILMDVQMPVLDGLQATKLIREKEKELGYKKKPIIGLTAHAIQGYKDKCIEAGMDAYTCKPFQMKQLIKVIQKVIEG